MKSLKRIIAISFLGLAWWLIVAAVLPLAQDEAYYVQWSHYLDFGYFDHPPLVALMAATSKILPSSFFFARLGNVILAALTVFVSGLYFRRLGLRDKKSVTVALALGFGNLLGLAYGVITTPDTVLLLAWCVALNEGAAALSGTRWRWLTAGLATGVGLEAKYTMLIIGLVFLFGLLRSDKPALKTPWPYLGGLVALLIFTPNILWNAEHDWITFRFQLRHGLTLERPDSEFTTFATDLPRPLLPDPTSAEAKLASAFDEMEEAQEEEEKRPRWYDSTLKSLNRYVGFYGSQLALWGFLLPLLISSGWKRRRDPFFRKNLGSTSLASPLLPFVNAAWAIPLFVFGLLSLLSKVEANWSCMYVVSAAAVMTPWVREEVKKVLVAVLLNFACLVLVISHARFGILPVRPHHDRILKESHGYYQLAKSLETLEGRVFADSYQITSLLNFYKPHLKIEQWPGVTRDSELIRRLEFNRSSYQDLMRQGGFWLVTTDRLPPRLPGFTAVALNQLRDCKNEGLQEISTLDATQVNLRCKKAVHEWYLIQYQASSQ